MPCGCVICVGAVSDCEVLLIAAYNLVAFAQPAAVCCTLVCLFLVGLEYCDTYISEVLGR